MVTKENNFGEIYLTTAKGYSHKIWDRTINAEWIGGFDTISTKKENENMEEKLNKFIEENNVEVDGDKIYMYMTVHNDNLKDYEVGTIFKEEKSLHLTSVENAKYELRRDWNTVLKPTDRLKSVNNTIIKLEINKNNVSNISNPYEIVKNIRVNKYKVVEILNVETTIHYEIQGFIKNEKVAVKVFNKYTNECQHIEVLYTLEKDKLEKYIKEELNKLDKEYELKSNMKDVQISI